MLPIFLWHTLPENWQINIKDINAIAFSPTLPTIKKQTMNLKVIIKTLLVYIPFSVCVLIQIAGLLAFYAVSADGDKALLMKVLFPVLFITSLVLYIKNHRKNVS